MDFQSCCSGVNSGQGQSDASGDDSGSGVARIMLTVIGTLGGIGLVFVCVYIVVRRKLCFRKRESRLAKHIDETIHDDTSKPPAVDQTTNLPCFTLPDPERGRVDEDGLCYAAPDLRSAAANGHLSASPLPPAPAVPHDTRSSAQARKGVYEGPVSAWWLEGNASAGNDPTTSSALPASDTGCGWRKGDKVRLCGLEARNPSEGAIGKVEWYNEDSGLVHVRLPDGRLLQVRPENCESPAAPSRPMKRPEPQVYFPALDSHGQQLSPVSEDGRSKGFGVRPDATSRSNADVGAGVTSWLASTPTNSQSHRTTGNYSDNWARQSLPSRSAGTAPPVPPVPGQPSASPSRSRSASSGPAASPVKQTAAVRASSQGANAAASAMSLTPGGNRAGSSPPRAAPGVAPGPPGAASGAAMAQSSAEAHRHSRGLTVDLLQAQQRDKAKLASLKKLLATP